MRCSRTKAWVEPDSNQTSTMSRTWSYSSALYVSPRKSWAGRANQESEPSASKIEAMRSSTAGSRSGWPSFFEVNSAIGTPQARWRLMHQSGRPETMAWMRLRPWGGTQRVSSMACSALARNSFFSIEMNHCGVVRKISGALERQEQG